MALAPNLWWLFVGRVISGITAASISTAYAYVADVTEPAQRAARFGMLGVAFGAGFVLGPALGGLAGSVDPRLPFWIAGVLSLVNGVYGLLVLPESLPREQRAPFEWRRANPLGSLRAAALASAAAGARRVSFLGHLAHASLPNIGVLYMMYRYGWDERAVGFTMAGVGVCAMIVQGALIGPAVARFGERSALIAGLVFGVAGFAVFGLAATGTCVLGRHSAAGAVGLRQRRRARADEPHRRPERARPAAGRQCQHHGYREPARPRPVRADLRVSRSAAALASAGRGVPARGVDPGAGDDGRLGDHRGARSPASGG